MTDLPDTTETSIVDARLRGRARRMLIDLLMGGAIVVGLWLTAVPPEATSRAWQWALAAAALVAVVLRIRIPIGATVSAATATALAWALGATADPGIMVGLCLFAVAERRGTRVFPWWLWLSAAAVSALTFLIGGSIAQDGLRVVVLSAVVVSSAWALGTRSRQVKQEALARARAEERLRLAREVHDVLSHSLGTIGVQAGIAAHVATLGPDDLRRTLHEVEHDARASLTELRGLLRAEREDLEEAPGAPLTTSIRSMMQSLERAGIRVETEIPDGVDELPLVQRQTIRRVVQEAVTNTIRHSGANRCRISVETGPREIAIEVHDDGHGAGGSLAEGHGLTGMRERAGLLGGRVEAGDAGRGFLVRVVMPVEGGEDR